MKNNYFIPSFLIFILACCCLVFLAISMKPLMAEDKGPFVKLEKKIQHFNHLELKGVAEYILVQDNQYKLWVEASQESQALVIVNNRENKLHISTKKTKWRKSPKIKIYIHFKQLDDLICSGVGDVKSLNDLHQEALNLNVKGVGDVRLNLFLNALHLKSSGVGDVKLMGQVNDFTLSHSGVGDLKASKMIAQNVHLKKSSVGDVNIYASKTLSIDSKGVGDVSYSGSAKISDLNSRGVGKVKRKK